MNEGTKKRRKERKCSFSEQQLSSEYSHTAGSLVILKLFHIVCKFSLNSKFSDFNNNRKEINVKVGE